MLPVFVDSVYVGPGQDQLFYDLCESLFCRISQRRVAPSIRSLNGGSACQESLDNGNDPTPCSEHERSFAAHQREPAGEIRKETPVLWAAPIGIRPVDVGRTVL